VDQWGDYVLTVVVDIGVVSEGVANSIGKRNNSLGSLNLLGLSLVSLLNLVNNRVDIRVVKSISQGVKSTVGDPGVSLRIGLSISNRLSLSLSIRVNSWAVVAIVVWTECIVVGGGVVIEVVVQQIRVSLGISLRLSNSKGSKTDLGIIAKLRIPA